MGSKDTIDMDTSFVEILNQRLTDVPRRPTTYEIVKQLAPAINEVRARGHNFQFIAKLLASAGLQLSPATIRTYLRRMRRESALAHHDNGQLARPRPTRTAPTPTVTRPSTNMTPTPTPSREVQRTMPRTPPAPGEFELVPDSPELTLDGPMTPARTS